MKWFSKRGGFTLVEVLVVITIIGILATIGYTAYDDSRQQARDAKRIQEVNTIAKVLQLYLTDAGGVFDCADGIEVDGGYTVSGTCNDSAMITSILDEYLTTIPTDPLGPGDADYYYYIDGKSCGNEDDGFFVWAQMEVPGSSNRDAVCDPADGAGSPIGWSSAVNNDGDYTEKGGQERYPYVVRVHNL